MSPTGMKFCIKWQCSIIFLQSVSSNLTEIQVTNALDLGKVLWNGRYINSNCIFSKTLEKTSVAKGEGLDWIFNNKNQLFLLPINPVFKVQSLIQYQLWTKRRFQLKVRLFLAGFQPDFLRLCLDKRGLLNRKTIYVSWKFLKTNSFEWEPWEILLFWVFFIYYSESKILNPTSANIFTIRGGGHQTSKNIL